MEPIIFIPSADTKNRPIPINSAMNGFRDLSSFCPATWNTPLPTSMRISSMHLTGMGMDGTPTRSSCGRQPYECLYRFKLGLTEDNPSIKTYDPGCLGKPAGFGLIPVNVSVTLLHALQFTLGGPAAVDFRRTMAADIVSSEYKKNDVMVPARPVCLAWTSSCGTISGHYATGWTGTNGIEYSERINFSHAFTGLSLQNT